MEKLFFIFLIVPNLLHSQIDTLVGTDKTTSFAYHLDTTSQGLDSFFLKWTDEVQYPNDLIPRSFSDYLFFVDTNEINTYIDQLSRQLDNITTRALIISDEKALIGKRLDAVNALRDSVIRGMEMPIQTFNTLYQIHQVPEKTLATPQFLAVFRRRRYRKKKK